MSILITEVKNGQYLEDGKIDCEINHPVYGWIPYTIDDNDDDNTIDNAQLKLLLGENINPFIPPSQEELDAIEADRVRNERNMRLSMSVDPLVCNVLRWNELTDAQRSEWSQYRTDLLNVPQQEGFPWSVTWPSQPE